jgi:hypothetical protein
MSELPWRLQQYGEDILRVITPQTSSSNETE